MSYLTYNYEIHEIACDKDGTYIKEYQKDLPHAKELADAMCKSWNDMHMEQYYDSIAKDKIESAVMKPIQTNDGTCVTSIRLVAKPGVRLTEKLRNELFEQTDAQFSDGWGESFFGTINIMHDADRNYFYPD